MIRALALDFDGVILESVEVKDKAIYNLFDLTEIERQRILELHRNNPGINRRTRMELLLREGLGREPTAEAVDNLIERFKDLVLDGLSSSPEVPGIRCFLEELSGLPCYVVSAAPQEELRYIAEQRSISPYFKDLCGWPPRKTDLLREVARRENADPESILFIGDKISDYEAACSIGTKFVGRKTPKNPTLFPEQALVIHNFHEAIPYIHC